MFLEFLAIRMDSKAAEAAGLEFKINLVNPDRGETYVLELNNATLTNIEGYVAEDADLTITVDRNDLDEMMTGQTTWDALVSEGKATFDGNIEVLAQLMSTMVTFTADFEMLPGTKRD